MRPALVRSGRRARQDRQGHRAPQAYRVRLVLKDCLDPKERLAPRADQVRWVRRGFKDRQVRLEPGWSLKAPYRLQRIFPLPVTQTATSGLPLTPGTVGYGHNRLPAGLTLARSKDHLDRRVHKVQRARRVQSGPLDLRDQRAQPALKVRQARPVHKEQQDQQARPARREYLVSR